MKLAQLNDGELVERATGGDEAAFTELLARHDGRAFQVALSMLRDGYDDASDAMQEARIACWQSINTYDEQMGEFAPWYMTIVRNACNRLYKQRQRTTDWMSYAEVDEIIRSPVPTPEELLVAKEERHQIRDILIGGETLTPAQSQAIRLHCVEGHSYPEIADALGVGEVTVRTLVSRGLGALKEKVGNVGLGA